MLLPEGEKARACLKGAENFRSQIKPRELQPFYGRTAGAKFGTPGSHPALAHQLSTWTQPGWPQLTQDMVTVQGV